VFADPGNETTGIRIIGEVPDASLTVFSDGKQEDLCTDAGIFGFIGSMPDMFQNADDPGICPVGNGTKRHGPVSHVRRTWRTWIPEKTEKDRQEYG
jgi:hypothetical protein